VLKTFAVAANASTTLAEKRGAKLVRAVFGAHALALADQAVVSGASFLTTVLIGRSTDAGQLGVYSLGISLVVSLVTIQDSLISLPYTIQLHHPIGTPAESAGSSLMHCCLLSALGIAVVAAAGLGLISRGAESELVALTWTLAGVVPFALLRQFGRRFAFAHLNMRQALMIDVPIAVIQLTGLLWLAWTGRLSSVTACLILGAACASTAIAWLYLARGNFAIRTDQLRAAMKQSWNLGKWFFATQITLLVQGNISYWLLSAVTGATATGVYAACMSVVSLANPLIVGLDQVLMPSAVRAFKERSSAGLWSEVIRASLLLGAATTLPCAVVLFAGEDVMRLLYHTHEYEGQGHAVMVLALALPASAMGIPASNALATMERPRPIFVAGLLAAVVTAFLVLCLAVEWGVTGAAYGFLGGSIVGSVGRWIAFLTLVPRCGPETAPVNTGSDPNSAPVIKVLQQFTQSIKCSDLVVERLNEGAQAHVFAVRSQDHQPIWQTHRSLVVKLYKPEAAPSVELVRAQFHSLSRLDTALVGCTINGWKISIPEQLYLCESPLAVVMSMVPGRKLDLCLEMPDSVVPEVLESAACAVAAAMARYWSTGQLYGELSFTNILCDFVARRLSFVDAGMPTNSFRCNDISNRWYPASHDLAYMLFYVARCGLKRDIGNPGARLRKEMFIESALLASIQTIGQPDEKQSLLDEIRACARGRLKKLDQSWSLHGLQCTLLGQIASRRIDRIIGRVKADLDLSTEPAESSFRSAHFLQPIDQWKGHGKTSDLRNNHRWRLPR
jgi:O-antigen/teichoic acid export membrane protein